MRGRVRRRDTDSPSIGGAASLSVSSRACGGHRDERFAAQQMAREWYKSHVMPANVVIE